MYRSFVEMEHHFPKSTKGWMLFRLWMKSMLLILFAASVMFFIETLGELPFFINNGFAHLYQCQNGDVTQIQESCGGGDAPETWSVSFAFYFTVVVSNDHDVTIIR